ncbi:MAG TPA: tRNA lysidine(34) synthetase TilS [Tepidisphaeraceae bacterium]
MSPHDALQSAIAWLPPGGAWAVGVSGGADSVALLAMLRTRPDLRLHAAHLDHETRGDASAADARFVAELCARWGIPCTVRRRGDLEAAAVTTATALPANRAARFRALRLSLFQDVCAAHGLDGVLLAHHADDQAETIFQRLLRGSGPMGLTGIQVESFIKGLRIVRPLLDIPGRDLRDFLRSIAQAWREDASNASPAYQRNRVRAALARHPVIADASRAMGCAMGTLVSWVRTCAPALGEAFAVRQLAELPDVLATESARRWLAAQGAPAEELSPVVIARLVEMARDAATPARAHFPGKLWVGRRGGRISVVSDAGPSHGGS